MSTNATSAAEDVNSLLGLSRNNHKTMLDVFYDYFTTHHEDSEQESDDCESQETLIQPRRQIHQSEVFLPPDKAPSSLFSS